MKKPTLILPLLASLIPFTVLSAEVVTFYDDFERAEIGDDWLESGGQWWIEETEEWGHVLRSGSSNPHVLIHQGLELDAPWEMEINFHFLGMDFSWAGATFHAHFDGNIFRNYVSRMKTTGTEAEPGNTGHQFIEFENFAIPDDGWVTVTPQAPLVMNVSYRMVISSSEPGSGVFDFAVYDADDTALIEAVMEVQEPWNEPFTGGWAGLYDIRNMAVYDFRLSVGEPDVDEVTFESWQAAHFDQDQMADPEVSGPDASPAGDGVENLLKYALGLSPFEPSRHLLPVPVLKEGHLALTYERLKNAADIVYRPEVAVELASWQSGQDQIEETSVEDLGESERVTVRAVSPVAAESRQFLRLAIEKTN